MTNEQITCPLCKEEVPDSYTLGYGETWEQDKQVCYQS